MTSTFLIIGWLGNSNLGQQEDVILVPHICLVPLQGTVYPKWSHWQHFPSVSSCFVSLIFSQKQHYIVRRWVQSSWFLIQHQNQYTPQSLMSIGSDWSISTCTKYHLACVEPTSMFLMKRSLSFELSILLLTCLIYLWSPNLSLLVFLRRTNTPESCS